MSDISIEGKAAQLSALLTSMYGEGSRVANVRREHGCRFRSGGQPQIHETEVDRPH